MKFKFNLGQTVYFPYFSGSNMVQFQIEQNFIPEISEKIINKIEITEEEITYNGYSDSEIFSTLEEAKQYLIHLREKNLKQEISKINKLIKGGDK